MALSKGPLSRAEKKERTTTELKGSNCIAAIDFGTSSVSLAYKIPHNADIKMLKLHRTNERVPNAILIQVTEDTGRCTVNSIGHVAQDEYCQLESEEIDNYIYFERMKMLLERDKTINRNTTVTSFTGGSYYLIEVIAFIIKFLKEKLLSTLKHEYRCSDFDWVITVPAIWKARARRMMREAAYLAGLTSDYDGIPKFTRTSRKLEDCKEVNPHKLTLALEPEAAAIYAHKYFSKGSPPPPRYMVVDIGEGTVDITAHERIAGRIGLLLPPTGNTAGGTTVNEAIRCIIENALGDKGHQGLIKTDKTATAELNNLYYQVFEEEKKKFGNSNEDDVKLLLPTVFVDYYGKDNIKMKTSQKGMKFNTRNNVLSIPYHLLEKEIFQNTTKSIVQCIKNTLDKLTDKINTIYLVGEFGGCQYLIDKIKQELRSYCGIKYDDIICPIQPDLAVTIGAVMWRQDPDIIQSRIADATYGICMCPIFDPSIHDEHYQYKGKDDNTYCRDVFQVLAHKGEVVDKGFCYKHNFEFSTLQPITLPIYATTEDNVQYTVDKEGKPTVTKIGELMIDTKLVEKTRQANYVEISIEFTGNEILVTGTVTSTGEVVKTVCDFLTFQEDIEMSEYCKVSLLETNYKILYKDSEMRKQQIEKSHETLMHRFKMKENSYSQLQRSHTQLQERFEVLQHQLQLKENELGIIHSHFKAKGDIKNWTISHKELNITSHELGRGGWGVIMNGQLKVAVKQIHGMIVSQHSLEQLNREITTMAQLRHPNLLLFIGAVFDHPSGNPMIITEVMDTSLRKAYEDKVLTPDQQPVTLSIMRDVAVGLNYLHSLPDPIIHRDVSSANVLLNRMGPGKWQTKISDFGSAKIAKSAVTQMPGAPVYSAPEVSGSITTQDETKQTTKLDVFSYGILLCEMATCTFPDTPNTFRKMLAQLNATRTGTLINWCIQNEPSNRPTTQQVIKELDRINPFFKHR